MPIRKGFAKEVYVISSAEMMALYAADNIAQAIRNFGSRGYAKLSGLIHISRNIDNEDEIVARAAREIGTQVIGKLSRSKTVQDADQQQKTVHELFPDSQIVKEYQAIASALLKS
jgi:nitrogenase iron protein NifH